MPPKTRQTRQIIRAAFLEAMREYGNIYHACQVSGMDRGTVYWLQEHDETFSLEFQQADAIATERLEKEAYRRAHDGVEKPVYYVGVQIGAITEYSDGLLQFLLKARRPDKYKDRLALDIPALVKVLRSVDADKV